MVFQFMVFLTVSNLRSGCVVPEVCLVGYTPYKTRKIIPALWGKFPSRFSAKHVGGGTAHATGMVALVNIYLVKRPFHRHTVRRLFALSGCPIVEENLLGKSVRCRENQLGKSGLSQPSPRTRRRTPKVLPGTYSTTKQVWVRQQRPTGGH